jgi:hypothetical protein
MRSQPRRGKEKKRRKEEGKKIWERGKGKKP